MKELYSVLFSNSPLNVRSDELSCSKFVLLFMTE